MNLKAFICSGIILFFCVCNARGQGFADSSEAYMTHVKRSLLMPTPPNDVFCPRVYFDAHKQTVTFEYAGTIYKDTRSLEEGHYFPIDSVPGRPYPRKEVIDWGSAEKIGLHAKAALKPDQVQWLKKIYGTTAGIISCMQRDINDDGKKEWIVIRNADRAPMLMKPMGIKEDSPVFVLDVFSSSEAGFVRRYQLAYHPELTEINLSLAKGSGLLQVLFLQVYNAKSGAFQVGCDTIVW